MDSTNTTELATPPSGTTPTTPKHVTTPTTMTTTTRLPTGVYVPMLAFFTPSDTIDVPATQRHAARLLAAGVAGLVVHGSNGEAAHLSREERCVGVRAVADAARHAADKPGRVPVIAGCGAQSVRETVELCAEARGAGATHALVLPPGYYAGLLGPAGLVDFFAEVADRSPLPVLVYNFPAAAHGVDLDSDVLLRIAAHPNVVGVKLTCGNTGKLARVAAEAPKVRGGRDDFFVAGGSADFLLQGMVVGGHGTIAGFANLAPRACVRIVELFEQGRFAEARELQAEVARADWLAIRYGFVGVKAAMPMFHGEGERASCAPRSPLKRLPRGGKAEEEIREGMAGVMAIEAELAKMEGSGVAR
ncbi:aldolase [Phialemonium atrogriseum]|uniref:Aldolase n=1 Tax=Phialemonium atrogriseum TaxID=1093897 RepID=A0AAJ0FRE4_9PEZI|nr:aldolase [Phialemonium atrogriseum]KAK1770055.1 aldolase [Phialemonium atrogriseum]